MDISAQDRRRAFSHWMRTGIWSGGPDASGIEHKFNPYHDPRNGQFTFAPGGPRSLSHVVISYGHRANSRALGLARSSPAPSQTALTRDPAVVMDGQLSQAVYRPDESPARIESASSSRNPRAARGSNSGAFRDPMTLEQVFPGLRSTPAGGIVALADNLFDLTGPLRAANAVLVQNWTNQLVNQIRVLAPGYRYDSFGFPQTLQGQANQLNHLRWTRAAAFLRVKGELRPIEVETLRFMQESADRAYDIGLRKLRAGRLKVRLSEQEALGNFVDQQVRADMRERYALFGIRSDGAGPVRVNRRENDSSGSELSYRRPDARVGAIAFDVTLTPKNLQTQQVRGFFGTDFRPTHVIIVRPRQLGSGHTYVITRPELKR
ncbi:MAG TPA: hypothetical protein VLG14_15750 [Sphingomonas sp.]|jgi:hypothetical protein|nr:hypothetical protein [Sphingomonas sp.]